MANLKFVLRVCVSAWQQAELGGQLRDRRHALRAQKIACNFNARIQILHLMMLMHTTGRDVHDVAEQLHHGLHAHALPGQSLAIF